MDLFILTKFVLLSLAVYGFSELITIEDGPFNVFASLRDWLSDFPNEPYPNDPSDIDAITEWQASYVRKKSFHSMWTEYDLTFLRSFKGTLYGIFSCSYCMSTWVALFFVGILILATDVSTPWPLIVRDNIFLFFSSLAGHRILKRLIDNE